jgi:thiosulfate/3-mercaptopyruvate sulfurtransferase
MTEVPPLVTAAWLAVHLEDPSVRVVDVSVIATPPTAQGKPWDTRAAYEEWEAGHIPGAAFVDLVSELSDPGSPYPFTAPSATQADAVFARIGIDEGTHLVCYDGQGNAFAARARLVFRHFGLPRVSVLDGGIGAWQAAGGLLSTEAPEFPPGGFRARPGGRRLVGRAAVEAVLAGGGAQLVNVLTRSQWDGTEISSYARHGQIPGSLGASAVDLVDAESGRFVSEDEARALFDAEGVKLDEPILLYCGGGVSASKSALVLELLGADDVAVYDGSLSEWTADPQLPLELL